MKEMDDLYTVALYVKGVRKKQMCALDKETAYFTADYNNIKRISTGIEGVWLVMKYGREKPDTEYLGIA